jgi:hypothetical protein
MCRTSQACRAGAGSAANRRAAAKAGEPGASTGGAIVGSRPAGGLPDGGPCTGWPAAISSAAMTARWAGDGLRPPPMTSATMAGPVLDRSAAASAPVVMVGPGSWSRRSRWNTGGRPLMAGPASPMLTELPAPCR